MQDNIGLKSLAEITEMLSNMKTSLTNVLAVESLRESSREKLNHCVSTIEKISSILKNTSNSSENFLKPLHSGLSRSMDSLNVAVDQGLSESKSRSTSNLAEETDVYDNSDDDEINNLNKLKENYLQVLQVVNNNHKVNGEIKTEVNNIKPELNYAKPEVNTNVLEINSTKPEVNGINPEVNHTKPEVTSNPEVTCNKKPELEGAKRRRKRDSSTLFDISLDDLTEPDHSGILQEKHSGKEWWCVLQDQHLCMFPSQNPQELAYDVLLVPCCEISLDDIYTESPVFRLTQVGSTPWVFSAGIERNLRAWIRALYRACGRDDADKSMRSAGSRTSRRSEKKQKKKDMKVFTTTIEETEEVEDEEEEKEEEKEEGKEEGREENGEETDKEREKEEGKGEENEEEKGEEEIELDKEKGENKEEENKEKIEEEKEKPEEKGEETEKEEKGEETEKEGKGGEESKGEEEGKRGEKEDDMEEKTKEIFIEKQEENRVNEKGNDKQEKEMKDGNHETTKQQTFPSKEQGIICRNCVLIENQNLSKRSPQNSTSREVSDNGNTSACQQTIARKATKRRIKILRWLKKTILGSDNEDVSVVGDIYKLEGPNNERVRLWCLVRNRQLYCYRSVTEKEVYMVIPLEQCYAVPDTSNSSQQFSFHIVKNNENICTFAAKSAKERARWVEIVKNRRGTICLGEFAEENEETEEIEGSEGSEGSNGSEGSEGSEGIEESEESEECDEDGEGYVYPNGGALHSVLVSPDDSGYVVSLRERSEGIEESEESEECDEDGEGYVYPNGGALPSVLVSPNDSGYVLSLRDSDETNKAEYVSVLELETEITRQKTLRIKKYNPNVTSRTDLKNLTEKETPLVINSLSKNSPLNTSPRAKQRLPAPLPKTTACLVGKRGEGESKDVAAGVESLENSADQPQRKRSREESQIGCVDDVDGEDCDAYVDMDEYNMRNLSNGDSVQDVNSQGIIVECMTTATSWLQDSPPGEGKLGPRTSTEMTGAWRPEINDKNQFLEFDLGEIISVSAIGIRGRPDSDENGGEFVKTFTIYHSKTSTIWAAYKHHGKTKVFPGNTNAYEEVKKCLKSVISARYIRVCPQSWHNHIALQVAFYKEQVTNEKVDKSKSGRKKLVRSAPVSPEKKKEIAFLKTADNPDQPNAEEESKMCKSAKESEDQVFLSFTDEPLNPVLDENHNTSLGAQSIESRIELKEKLLTKEKKDHIFALEILKKRMDYAKDKMIVVNNSTQSKSEAVDAEEQYVTANLELIKVKKRLIGIEKEMRELRLFASHHREQKEEMERPKELVKPSKPAPLKRRPSKEIKLHVNANSPVVDQEAFNSPGDPPPARTVMNNVKLFEHLCS